MCWSHMYVGTDLRAAGRFILWLMPIKRREACETSVELLVASAECFLGLITML